ncbi:hypothetical protein CLOM621_05954 [Clostridium sp. M62/1]|nr:hypothetical protein CLOM621_05954 [Clostridium sp. M62/1]
MQKNCRKIAGNLIFMQAGPLSCFCNHITAARMRRIAFKKADYLERIRK